MTLRMSERTCAHYDSYIADLYSHQEQRTAKNILQTGEDLLLEQILRVSEPWKFRVSNVWMGDTHNQVFKSKKFFRNSIVFSLP